MRRAWVFVAIMIEGCVPSFDGLSRGDEDAAEFEDAEGIRLDSGVELADVGSIDVRFSPEPDAASRDAASPDAARPDAGALDAEPLDSGALDAGAPGEPDTSQLGDTPYFETGAELCDYVNQARMSSSGHDRYRGGSNAGYHQTRTWPLTFTVDPALMIEARDEALRLEAGGSPLGSSFGDGFRYRRLQVDGINSASYRVTARDEPGDWNASYFKSGLINAHAAARQYLYYHDPGGSGAVLRHIGCAGANAGGGAVWWVVILRP